MNKRIAWKNMPARPAGVLWSAAVGWLYLDRYQAPDWLVGGLCVLGLMAFAASLIEAYRSTSVDIFEGRP